MGPAGCAASPEPEAGAAVAQRPNTHQGTQCPNKCQAGHWRTSVGRGSPAAQRAGVQHSRSPRGLGCGLVSRTGMALASTPPPHLGWEGAVRTGGGDPGACPLPTPSTRPLRPPDKRLLSAACSQVLCPWPPVLGTNEPRAPPQRGQQERQAATVRLCPPGVQPQLPPLLRDPEHWSLSPSPTCFRH